MRRVFFFGEDAVPPEQKPLRLLPSPRARVFKQHGFIIRYKLKPGYGHLLVSIFNDKEGIP